MGRQRDQHVFFYRSAMYYYAKRLRSIIRRRAIVEHGYSDQLRMSVCLCLMHGDHQLWWVGWPNGNVVKCALQVKG